MRPAVPHSSLPVERFPVDERVMAEMNAIVLADPEDPEAVQKYLREIHAFQDRRRGHPPRPGTSSMLREKFRAVGAGNLPLLVAALEEGTSAPASGGHRRSRDSG